MGVLSDGQFADRVNQGGASRFLHTGEEVPLTRGNYAVSDPNHELKLAHPIVRELVTIHRERMLDDPTLKGNPQALEGGWSAVPPPPAPPAKLGFLDSSALVTGRRKAVARGNADKQIAVYSHSRELDSKSDTEVYMRRTGLKAPAGHKVVGNRSAGYTVEPRRKKD